MPLMKVATSVALPDEKRNELLASLSKILAETIGKPEQYVMVTISTESMIMSGQKGDSAFADVRSIGGLNRDVNRKIAQRLCALLKESLGIPPDRVYVNFADIASSNWGWNGSTFG
ncbi:MAG: phenylpyruvate tautomerase MIF-related protein [Pseudomonadota bacterium]